MQNYIDKLINETKQNVVNAYAPYSNFYVSAGLLLKDNKIITGINVENVSYGLSMCAERTALFKAYSMGYTKDDILAMCVYADVSDFIKPCGACRQVMVELVNKDVLIYLCNNEFIKEVTVGELLPYSFEELE